MDRNERIVNQVERIEELEGQYATLLQLLANVVTGDTDHTRVLVNLTDRSWTVASQGQMPAMPATINGLPRVVVGLPIEREAEPAPEPLARSLRNGTPADGDPIIN